MARKQYSKKEKSAFRKGLFAGLFSKKNTKAIIKPIKPEKLYRVVVYNDDGDKLYSLSKTNLTKKDADKLRNQYNRKKPSRKAFLLGSDNFIS